MSQDRPDESDVRNTDVWTSRRMPPWIWKAVIVFWLGFLGTILIRYAYDRLFSLLILIVVSLFLALAIEPGVNRLYRRGWKRGRATIVILLAVIVLVLVF